MVRPPFTELVWPPFSCSLPWYHPHCSSSNSPHAKYILHSNQKREIQTGIQIQEGMTAITRKQQMKETARKKTNIDQKDMTVKTRDGKEQEWQSRTSPNPKKELTAAAAKGLRSSPLRTHTNTSERESHLLLPMQTKNQWYSDHNNTRSYNPS